jgi:hypothetical protein
VRNQTEAILNFNYHQNISESTRHLKSEMKSRKEASMLNCNSPKRKQAIPPIAQRQRGNTISKQSINITKMSLILQVEYKENTKTLSEGRQWQLCDMTAVMTRKFQYPISY